MRVAGEHQNLVGLGEITNCQERIPRAGGVEIDEDVIKDNRKRIRG
jgi:hypothetical protein